MGEEARRQLWAESRHLGRARMAGRLLDLGAYPALLPCGRGSSWVSGEVAVLENADQTFCWLDTYEGIGVADGTPCEYVRIKWPAVLDDGREIVAWVYAYGLDHAGLPEIESGIWCSGH